MGREGKGVGLAAIADGCLMRCMDWGMISWNSSRTANTHTQSQSQTQTHVWARLIRCRPICRHHRRRRSRSYLVSSSPATTFMPGSIHRSYEKILISKGLWGIHLYTKCVLCLPPFCRHRAIRCDMNTPKESHEMMPGGEWKIEKYFHHIRAIYI